MPKIKIEIEITQEEWDAVHSYIESIEAWTVAAIREKVRKRVDAVVEEQTGMIAYRKTQAEKIDLLKNIKIPTKAEREKSHLLRIPK